MTTHLPTMKDLLHTAQTRTIAKALGVSLSTADKWASGLQPHPLTVRGAQAVLSAMPGKGKTPAPVKVTRPTPEPVRVTGSRPQADAPTRRPVVAQTKATPQPTLGARRGAPLLKPSAKGL